MKIAGLTLITVAFLAGAYLASLDPEVVSWTPLLILLAFGFVGVYLVRQSDKEVAGSAEALESGTRELTESLRTALAELDLLISEKDDLSVYDLPGRIDERIVASLNRFAANRNTLKHAYGLQAFADVMSRYAGGERYLNRVWSAAVDGYIDEAHTYLDRSREQLAEALNVLGAQKRVEPAG